MRDLKLITGKVENLQVTHGYDNFVFSQNSQKAAGVAATAGVAVGSFFNASVIANAGISSREKVEFFTCTVDGLPLAGRFKKVSFKDGDELDFVIEYTSSDQQAAIAHAVRDPGQRLLWVVPEQERGTIAKKKDNIEMAKILSGFMGVLGFVGSIFAAFILGFENREAWMVLLFGPLFMGGVGLLLGMLTSGQSMSHAKKANKVIAALGYENPEEIDLMKNQLEVSEKLRAENKLVKRSDFASIRY